MKHIRQCIRRLPTLRQIPLQIHLLVARHQRTENQPTRCCDCPSIANRGSRFAGFDSITSTKPDRSARTPPRTPASHNRGNNAAPHQELVLNAQKAKNCHSDRSGPKFFLLLRSREGVGLRSGGTSVRFIAQASPLSLEPCCSRPDCASLLTSQTYLFGNA